MILYYIYIYISYLKRCLSIIFYPSTDWSVFLSALPPLHPSIHPSVVWRLPACPCGWFFRLYTQPMYVRTCMRIIIMNAYIYIIYTYTYTHTSTNIYRELWNVEPFLFKTWQDTHGLVSLGLPAMPGSFLANFSFGQVTWKIKSVSTCQPKSISLHLILSNLIMLICWRIPIITSLELRAWNIWNSERLLWQWQERPPWQKRHARWGHRARLGHLREPTTW